MRGLLWLSLTLALWPFSLLVRSVKVPWFSPHTQRAGQQGWFSQRMVLGSGCWDGGRRLD